jgi:hypothetical protein
MSRGVGGKEEKEEDLVSSRCAIPPWLEPPPPKETASRGLGGDEAPAERWDPEKETWVPVQKVDCGWDLHAVANSALHGDDGRRDDETEGTTGGAAEGKEEDGAVASRGGVGGGAKDAPREPPDGCSFLMLSACKVGC